MAGPNRPDDSPRDFGFLNFEPELPNNLSAIPDDGGFVGLPTAHDVPGFADLNFEEMQFTAPSEESPSVPDHSTPLDDSDSHESFVPPVSAPEPVAEADPELTISMNDEVNEDDLDENEIADESFHIPATAPPVESFENFPVLSSPPNILLGSPPAATAALAFGVASEKNIPQQSAVSEENWAAAKNKPTGVAPAALESTASATAASKSKNTSLQSVAATADALPAEAFTDKKANRGGAKPSPAVLGYAIAVTLFLLFSLITGRLSLTGNATLESLPDIRPLAPNEFRKVPDGTPVPDGHVLKLGESRRFGDVVVTPVRVTKEPMKFQGFLSGQPEDSLTTAPVLKLWLRFENRSGSYGFPPFDAGLMAHRTPPMSTDDSAVTNSFLTIAGAGAASEVRVLNYLQTMDSNFVLVGQESARVIMPNETLDTFIACSDQIATVAASPDSEYTWRVQVRKGVHEASGNGITTLVDVQFTGSEIR